METKKGLKLKLISSSNISSNSSTKFKIPHLVPTYKSTAIAEYILYSREADEIIKTIKGSAVKN